MDMNPNERDILIVEDSEIQAAILKRTLTQAGYKVAAANNGAQGLEMAQRLMPQLIISDVLMPVMDGYQMCRKIKDSDAIKGIPVILLTQSMEPEEVIKGLMADADNYITKPYDAGFLLQKVKTILENPASFDNRPDKQCTEFDYLEKHYSITTSRARTLNFLFCTYENAVIRNRELAGVQTQLKALNEQLEDIVRERTESLRKEVFERNAVEEALRESEERLRAIVASAHDAVICLEEPGNVYLWNAQAELMFGYSAAEAIGKDLHDLIVPERYRKDARAGLPEFFKSGKGRIIDKTLELEALRKDGTEFFVELSVSAVKLRGLWNSIGIIRDITGRKNLEQEMKQNFNYLERMNKLMVGRELKMEELRKEVSGLMQRIQELEKHQQA